MKFFLSFLVLFFSVNACVSRKPYDKLKHNARTNSIRRTDRFIDYVFPNEIDSLLTLFYRISDQKNPYIEIRNFCSGDSKISFALWDDQNIPISLDSIGQIRGSFEYTYTNRYAVINQGEFYIPITFDYDQDFVAGGDWRKDWYIRNSPTGRPYYIRFSKSGKLNWEINWQHLIEEANK